MFEGKKSCFRQLIQFINSNNNKNTQEGKVSQPESHFASYYLDSHTRYSYSNIMKILIKGLIYTPNKL